TVDLTGHDQHQLGICPTHLCIVSMPAPAASIDHDIVAAIRKAFQERDPNCIFVEAAPTDRTLTVTRMIIGWPIVIESQGRNLLEQYLQADTDGHFPHLFDLFPHSPGGRALSEYKDLGTFLHSVKEFPL